MIRHAGTLPACCAALVLAVTALSCASAPERLRSRGLEPARSTAQELSRALTPKRVAIVVGVSAYDDPAFDDLEFADDDAALVADTLAAETGGGFEQVVLAADPSATTRAAILEQLRRAAEPLRAEDVLVVYFSGHGTVAEVGDDGGSRLFLLPRDAAPADLPGTAVDLSELRLFFSTLKPQRKALVIDACFNGRGKSSVNPGLVPRVEELLATASRSDLSALGSGEAHLYATSLGRAAFEDPNLGRGIYTHYLVQAMSWERSAADLDLDGVITAYEAHDYARLRTMQHTNGAQVPEASLRVVGMNDVVLVGDPLARGERDRALVFDYGTGAAGAGTTLFVDGRAKGAFPGTLTVPPGQHHVELRHADGTVVLDGYARFAAGQSVGLGDLKVMARRDRILQAVRLGALGGPASSWGETWGGGAVALEGWGALKRARNPARGFLGAATFGLGVAPTREGTTGLVRRGRGTFWFGFELGWGGDWRRLRLRAAWQARATAVPIARVPGGGPETAPEEVGRMVFSMGPTGQIGVALDHRLSVSLAATLQSSPFRVRPEDPVRLHPFGTITAGLEVGL